MTILKQLRLREKKTQDEMAKLLGINKSRYCSYERGIRTIPPCILKKILLLRGCDEDKKMVKVLEEVYNV